VTSKKHSAAEILTSLVDTMDSVSKFEMAQAKLRRGLRGTQRWGRGEAYG
jgi:hypothetical protein